MDMHDDFDALLKGAGERFNEPALSGQAVSNIIDERLIASKNNLNAAFKKELLILGISLLGIALILVKTFTAPQLYKPTTLLAYRFAIMGGLVYMAGSLFLFLQLIRVAKLPKDTGIREYVKSVYIKTESALRIYLWVSTIAATGALGIVGWYWIFPAGVVMYVLNRWYTRKRFGRQLGEMKQLLQEFN